MMNETDTALEAVAEKFKAAGLTVRLDANWLKVGLAPASGYLQALLIPDDCYTRYLDAAEAEPGKLLPLLTTFRLDGYVYALFRCGDFEKVRPAKDIQLFGSGPGENIDIPVSGGRLLYERVSAHDLPEVPDIEPGQRAALIQDLARVFGPPDAKEKPPSESKSKTAKEPKGKKQQFPEEYPPGVPCEPWAKETPPILGFVWHSKLWKDMNAYSRIVVFMGQLAMFEKIIKGHTAKTPRWHIDDPFFASRKYVHTICKCSQRTVERVWQKLIKAHVLTRVPGTGKTGETSHWYFHGLGFPGKPKITTAGVTAATPVGDTDVAK